MYTQDEEDSSFMDSAFQWERQSLKLISLLIKIEPKPPYLPYDCSLLPHLGPTPQKQACMLIDHSC